MTTTDAPSLIDFVNLDFGRIELRSDNVLHFIPNRDKEELSIDELRELLPHFKMITGGVPRPFVTHNQHLTSPLTTEAKVFIGEHTHHFATACAVLESHPVTRFVAHSIMYLHKPQVPMRLFKNQENALAWLANYHNT